MDRHETTDAGIRVVVRPSQSSYFAGEPFSVSVTFTNTRSAEGSTSATLSQPRSASATASFGHKRAAHSVSSAPLAAPPTSPGMPRTPKTAAFFPASSSAGAGKVALNGIGPSASAGSKRMRRGLVGRGARSGTAALSVAAAGETGRRRKNMAKSLSLSINPGEFASSSDFDPDPSKPTPSASTSTSKSPVVVQRAMAAGDARLPSSPRVSSPLARSPSLPQKHPHARKHSVMDAQAHVHDVSPAPVPISVSVPPTPNTPSTPHAVSLDPISEGPQTPVPQTPSPHSPSPHTLGFSSTLPHSATFPPSQAPSHHYPPRLPKSAPRRPSQLGLGLGAPPAHTANGTANANGISQDHLALPLPSTPTPPTAPVPAHAPRSTSSSGAFAPPNTELILYSYAQLVGSVLLLPPPGASSAEQTRTVHALRASLARKPVMGGGSMDITATFAAMNAKGGSPVPVSSSAAAAVGRRRPNHGRSGSLFSLWSPASAVKDPAWSPGHHKLGPPGRSSSSISLHSANGDATANGHVGLGIALDYAAAAGGDEVDPETPLPTFEVQPAMLGVDLSLAPGESRTYTYTLALPSNLPPTFRGRALQFAYQLVVGTCRAGSGPGPSSSSSRIMKVPIRIYNHVSVGAVPRPYDLLWPVARRRWGAREEEARVVEGPRKERAKVPSKAKENGDVAGSGSKAAGDGIEAVKEYAARLAATAKVDMLHGLANGNGVPLELMSPPTEDVVRDQERERELGAEDGSLKGCREAVEILTRNPKRVSYDVNKDGVKVAVLTFTKSAYRLGETVLGVVELNELSSRARVLKLSAMLEAQEHLPSCISTATNTRHTRRIHAEHHSSFVQASLRTTFALDIPSDASPAFEIGLDAGAESKGNSGKGGLEWKVRLCLLVCVASEHAQSGAAGARTRHLVRDGPRGEWGTAWRAPPFVAPHERVITPKPAPGARPQSQEQEQGPGKEKERVGWGAWAASWLGGGGSAVGYHDGDEDTDVEEYAREQEDVEGELGWTAVAVETVECEVPVKVWPGNTAFRAAEVVFDL